MNRKSRGRRALYSGPKLHPHHLVCHGVWPDNLHDESEKKLRWVDINSCKSPALFLNASKSFNCKFEADGGSDGYKVHSAV